jgi:hypothetical protein
MPLAISAVIIALAPTLSNYIRCVLVANIVVVAIITRLIVPGHSVLWRTGTVLNQSAYVFCVAFNTFAILHLPCFFLSAFKQILISPAADSSPETEYANMCTFMVTCATMWPPLGVVVFILFGQIIPRHPLGCRRRRNEPPTSASGDRLAQTKVTRRGTT